MHIYSTTGPLLASMEEHTGKVRHAVLPLSATF